jgi:hypothetical protein
MRRTLPQNDGNVQRVISRKAAPGWRISDIQVATRKLVGSYKMRFIVPQPDRKSRPKKGTHASIPRTIVCLGVTAAYSPHLGRRLCVSGHHQSPKCPSPHPSYLPRSHDVGTCSMYQSSRRRREIQTGAKDGSDIWVLSIGHRKSLR